MNSEKDKGAKEGWTAEIKVRNVDTGTNTITINIKLKSWSGVIGFVGDVLDAELRCSRLEKQEWESQLEVLEGGQEIRQ